MDDVQKIKSFVESLHYRERSGPRPDPQVGCYPFVTISRQAGAGGQVLANVLLDKINRLHQEPLFVGWQLCNFEICRLLAQDPSLKPVAESLYRTEYHSHAEDMIKQLIFGGSSQDLVIKKMFQIMRAFAIHGKIIFVGRGSAFLTRDLFYGVHVRLIASYESRVRRMMDLLKIDEKKAREEIAEKDRAKAELVKTYFHHDVQDPLAFHVIWNTDCISVDEIADYLIGMIRKKAVEK